MRVLVTIQHPAHVHFYKHVIDELETEGHDVRVVARENEVAVDLLAHYGIDHAVLAGSADSLAKLAAVQVAYEARLYRHARRVDPDVVTGIGGVAAAHVARLVGAESVVFTDTEHATLINRLAHPVADVVATPACYGRDVGDNHVRYPGYHELAYLHPERFTPDEGVLDGLDVSPADRIAVVRVSSWDSSHDVGAGGFDDVGDAVARLEDAGARVFVTSEVPLPDELERCRLPIAPHRIHHLLAQADLFVGEGATMAAESAVLGTPAVYVNSLSMGYVEDLAEYGLLWHFDGPDRHAAAMDRALSILSAGGGDRFEARRARLLAENDDTTNVIRRLLKYAATNREPPAHVVGEPTVAAPDHESAPTR